MYLTGYKRQERIVTSPVDGTVRSVNAMAISGDTMYTGSDNVAGGDAVNTRQTPLEAVDAPVGTAVHPGQWERHAVQTRRAARGRSRGTAATAATVVPAGAPALAPPAPARSGWVRRYQAGLVLVDLVTVGLASLFAFAIRFGDGPGGQNNWLGAAVLPLAWIGLVTLNRGYEGRFVGVGAAEFQRTFHAFLHLTALVAFTSFVTHADLARGFVLVALPMALVLDVLGRYAARKWLHAQRTRGRGLNSVLIVGDPAAIKGFTSLLHRDRYAGMRVVGACVPSEVLADLDTLQTLAEVDVPLLGDVDSVVTAVRLSGAHTVAVVSSGRIGPEKLRWISWQLEGSSTDLVVSPGLIEVAGPRLHVQPVAGLPLLHIEEPEFAGFRRVAKGTFDRLVAAVAIVVLSPVLLGLWLAVRFSSEGPGFFRQERVGRDGRPFTMVKFRSMQVHDDAALAQLQHQNVNDDGLLFKIPDDPRVTSVGRVLRKFSLDELPQLINVVTGRMSLVGPRPPLPTEVARYGEDVRRRLLVKPGLTGLWQISGRSDLAWDEAVRLDLRYVENWSFALDLMILFKTVGAVVRGSGAY
jgi:exopolysaccharide biosynthesis polyprenyl glycosylphosphotransferase